jgi:hypothetical protein
MLRTFSTVKNDKVKQKLIFDQSPIGGLGSMKLKLFFILLPILLFVAIFNPIIFPMLGIASAVVFYIVFLSMMMILIAGLVLANNSKVVREIESSWDRLFPTVELPQVLSRGITPYKAFYTYYTELINKNLEEDALLEALKDKFILMQEENKELYEHLAMHRQDRRNQHV